MMNRSLDENENDHDEGKVIHRYGVESLSDVVIKLKSKVHVEYHVHKAILAQQSEYFKALIEGDRENKIIELPESFTWSADELKQALEVMYGVNLPALHSLASYNGKNIHEMYTSVGDKYQEVDGDILTNNNIIR
jgi:hypothetical protein